MKAGTKGQDTSIVDRNGTPIIFGDTVIFADKWEWYKDGYYSKIMFGEISKEDAIKEIERKPYETRIVESVQDYEWLLSSEIQAYWEVMPQKEILNVDTPVTTLRNKMTPLVTYFSIADKKGECEGIDDIIDSSFQRCQEVIDDICFLVKLIPDNAVSYDDSIPTSEITDEQEKRLNKIVHKTD